MAVFEQVDLRAIAASAGQWRGMRYLPLYAAGIVAGVAMGVGLTFLDDAPTQLVVRPTVPVVQPILTFPAARELPVIRAAAPGALLPDEVDVPYVEPPAPGATIGDASAPATADAPAAIAPLPPPAVVEEPPVTSPPAAEQPESRSIVSEPVAPARPNFYLPANVGGNSAAEGALLAGINAERTANGLPALVLDAGLTNVARIRSQQLVDQGYFGHVDPNGYTMYSELLAYFGYGYAWAGENLAMNNWDLGQSPERALEALMASATHRANILDGDFSRIGIGEVSTPEGRHYYAMIFLG